ncbi:uncharacterized protein EDB91DRAFT_81431 [Suillus paluster]|uniref:uncharacterized protein n=1 Tax=Suillus paluster TaxID=48578 RepID=UPI001B86CE26|nr:uncharacterized protein EDB91DRAFT_81431 [Suillus paluster]KAG1725786.1 hypothetical protein EDB91DRAFT_81431 [Suillus paluster]
MAPVVTPGEPREGNKPQPLGNFGLIFIFTTFTLCLLYLLWRRASALRAVVSHQLQTWTTTEGQIRLSEDDGPSATEFLVDADDEDAGIVDDGVILGQDEEWLRTEGNKGTFALPSVQAGSSVVKRTSPLYFIPHFCHGLPLFYILEDGESILSISTRCRLVLLYRLSTFFFNIMPCCLDSIQILARFYLDLWFYSRLVDGPPPCGEVYWN